MAIRSAYISSIFFLVLFLGCHSLLAMGDVESEWQSEDMIPYVLMHVEREYGHQMHEVEVIPLELEGHQHFALFKASFSNTALFFKFVPYSMQRTMVSFGAEDLLKKRLKVHSITNESIALSYHQELIEHPREKLVMAVYPFIPGSNLMDWVDENSATARVIDPAISQEAAVIFRQYGQVMGEVAQKTYRSKDGQGFHVHIADRKLRNAIWSNQQKKLYLVDFNFNSNGDIVKHIDSLSDTISYIYINSYQTLIDWDDSGDYDLKYGCKEWRQLTESQRQSNQCSSLYEAEARLIALFVTSFVKGYLSELPSQGKLTGQMYQEVKTALKMGAFSEDDYIFMLVRQNLSEMFPLWWSVEFDS